MSRKVEDRLSALTVSLVLLAVAVAVVGYYGWQKVDELEDQVTQLDRTVGTLKTQLSTANERLDVVEASAAMALQVATAARSDVWVLAADVEGMQGVGWDFWSRNMSELDDDLATVENEFATVENDLGTVEQCLRSIVDIVNGFTLGLDFRCRSLPFG